MKSMYFFILCCLMTVTVVGNASERCNSTTATVGAGPVPARNDGADQKIDHINAIKKSSDYLYADVTMPTLEDAISQAYEQLQREVYSWMEKDSIPAIEINSKADTIITQRANMFRVFAYTSKSEFNASVVGNASERCDTAKHKNVVAGDTIRQLLMQNFLGRKGGVIEQIKKARTFFELRQIMEPLKAKGDILDYGKYATAEKPEDCFLIVYDPAGNICALLGKGKEGNRWNMFTGKPDGIANYRGCGAIWFKLSK